MADDVNQEWLKRQAVAIGARVRRIREAQGLSVQRVADICTNEVGYKMLRTTLANLELGVRRNITIGELVVIAAALKVRPATILFPLDEGESVEILPGKLVSPWEAYVWSSEGELLLNSTDHGLDGSGLRIDWYENGQHYQALSTTDGGWKMFASLLSRMEQSGSGASQAMLDSTKRERSMLVERALRSYRELKLRGFDLPPLADDFQQALESALLAEDEEKNA